MHPDRSPDSDEQAAAVLSVCEQWRLLCWMEAHPRALDHDMTTGQSRPPATPQGRAPLAYAVGLAVGMAWLVLRRWW